MSTRTSRRALACALFATTALASPAVAQEASIAAFPVRQFQDENGVDLATGAFTALTPSISIGGKDMGLTYVRQVRQGQYRDTVIWNISVSGSTYTVGIGTNSEVFTLSNGVFTPNEQNGSSLTLSSGTYTYTAADGTVATFSDAGPTMFFGNARGMVVRSVTYPSGRTLTFYYREDSYVTDRGITRFGRRIQAVTTNAGYMMHFTYASDDASINLGGPWSKMVKVKGLNTSTDGCQPLALSCAQTGRPELTISNPSSAVTDYVDSEGRTTRYTITSGAVSAIRLPGSATDTVTVTYTSGKATSVTNRGVTTGYSYSDANGIRTVTVTRPGGATRVLTFDIAKSLLLSDQDERGKTRTFQYDANNRPTRVTEPEGNYTQFTYDSRGNVTETRKVAKSGSGAGDIVTTASFAASCSNPKTCNKPNSTTDARGITTDFTYDATHGGLTAVTLPPASSGATRPQVRTSWSRLDANGAASASGIFVPVETSTCQTGSAPSCIGTADEVKNVLAYGYGLLPSSVTTKAGDNSLVATTAMTYDPVGNLLTQDGPLAVSADTTRFRYNLMREQIGVVGPDPDGAGSLKHRAQRITIDGRGLVTKTEKGAVNSQSDADWAAFTSFEEVQQEYDANRRPTVRKLVSGGAIYALTQSSYDSRGRPDCVAIRMNPAAFGSLPASACTLGTQGSFGPDRITRTVYDAASNVTQVQVAVGTAEQANERTLTYTNNGQLASLLDAENNLTTFEYDDHDRLWKTRFPVTTKGANSSSTTDYEQLWYDPNGNVIQRRVRSGTVIGYSYDWLNRMGHMGSSALADVDYTYDLLGRPLTARFSSNSEGSTNVFDALGRLTSTTTNVGGTARTLSYQYDLAGRRTRLTFWDNNYFVYDRLVTGELEKVRLNGADSGSGVLVRFGYDDLGRRRNVVRGNGTLTAWDYDAVSRLTSLSHDLGGTTSDLSISYSYNPASQISSQTRSNDAYAWTGHGSGSTASTANGLNQLSTVGGITFTYDANGNLTSDGSRTFGYDVLNRLTSVISGGTTRTLSYDPLSRLESYNPGALKRFIYDGAEVVAELDASGSIARRFIRGDGADEVLLEYAGSGTSEIRYHHLDERGSDIAWSDPAGNLATISTYDEFGKPASSNPGRFQYTGQMWLPEIGLYHYKARVYDSRLGRFLQTDPIGYEGDGPNLYAYVLNDPVNFTDPSGLTCMNADGTPCAPEIVVTGRRTPEPTGSGCGLACSGFDFGGRAILLPGPFADQLNPGVICGDDECLEEVTITARRPTGDAPFYFTGTRYIPDPRYVKPWWSNYFDACFVVCPAVTALGAAVAPEVLALTPRLVTPTWSFGRNHTAAQWANRMARGGWTNQSISQALRGSRFPAVNNVNPANGATRFVHPRSGLSVVRDNATGEIIHLGAPGYRY